MSLFRRTALIATALAAGTVLVSCSYPSGGSGSTKLSVTESYIPLPATPGGMAAAYLTIHNDGGADHLLRVSSPGAKSVTMHSSSDGTMQELTSLPVPAHGNLELSRGGNHLMIMGWHQKPSVGDRLELDLTFARSGTIQVKVPIEPITYRPGSVEG